MVILKCRCLTVRNIDVQESPERGNEKREKAREEDRGGLAWKVRYQEQEVKMAALQSEFESTRLAAEAALARRSKVEEQMKGVRKQVRALMDKSTADDELIAALNAERGARAKGCASARSSHACSVHHSAKQAVHWSATLQCNNRTRSVGRVQDVRGSRRA